MSICSPQTSVESIRIWKFGKIVMSFLSFHFEKIGGIFEKFPLLTEGIVLLQRLILTCVNFFSFKYIMGKNPPYF